MAGHFYKNQLKPYRLLKRKMLSESAIMRSWQVYSDYWTPEEAEVRKASLEKKGWECKIVENMP